MAAIHWLNHAGFALRSDGGTCLVVDPWFSGEAFNRSWALQSETRTTIEDLADCRHIWISHEHPDHFSPAALKAFPAEQRREITVWYQATRDGRVLAFCEKLGFQVRAMPAGEPLQIGPDITARCGPVGFDSWLHLEVDGVSLLNVNDCEFPIATELDDIVAGLGSIDVLLQQFSYANGMSNPDDVAARQRMADHKLGTLARAIEVTAPKAVVPCASYVWFCHEENDYLNDSVVTIDRASAAVEADGVPSIVLYPGDTWELLAPHDNTEALARYAADVELNAALPRATATPVTDEQLLEASAAAQVRLRKKNQLWALRPFARTRYLRPAVLRVTDSPTGTFRYDMFDGLQPLPGAADADLELSGESLLFCLQQEFGMNTLLVNGRFVELRPGGLLRVRLQFSPSTRNNHGQSFPGVFLNRRFLTTEARKLVTNKRRALSA